MTLNCNAEAADERQTMPARADLTPGVIMFESHLYALDRIVIGSHIQSMYEVVVSDEFARWFEALADEEAESVAALLGVVGELGPGLGPELARSALLWFDGCHGREPFWQQEWQSSVESLAAFDAWRLAALRCLESKAFSRLLVALDGEGAAAVLHTVERLRHRLRVARWAFGSVLRPSLRGRVALAAELREAFAHLLARVGLEPSAVHESSGGLREVTLAELAPAARVIYGLDTTARRVIALAADRLDHAYHGDCVRLAEARYREYLAGRSEGARPLDAARGA